MLELLRVGEILVCGRESMGLPEWKEMGGQGKKVGNPR